VTDKRIKLALFAASPIYYQVPLYRRIANDPHIDFTAIYASSGGVRAVEMGFGQPVQWDVDMLSGYRSLFLRRANINPIGDGNFFTLRDLDIVKTLRSGHYDVLWQYGYNYLSHQLGFLTQVLRRKPVLFREDQTLLHSRAAWKLALKKAALPLLFRRCFGLYVGTQNYRWLRHYGARKERMYFVPYCVDNEGLQDKARRLQSNRDDLLRRFGLAATRGPVILSVARLIPKKQPLFLLEAFARVRAHRQCSLLIVGSGPLESVIREKIRKDHIPDVVLAGFLNQSEIANAYACADIFVLASKINETWGIVVNEAMNFGLPVIASDKVGSAVDLVRPGENGYIVRSDVPDGLTRSLMQLVDSNSERKQFGNASLRLIKGFNYGVASEGVLRAVEDAVGSRRWNEAAQDHDTSPRVGLS
jgi:glycosyltransferase involved in cell wall biosynthesis